MGLTFRLDWSDYKFSSLFLFELGDLSVRKIERFKKEILLCLFWLKKDESSFENYFLSLEYSFHKRKEKNQVIEGNPKVYGICF